MFECEHALCESYFFTVTLLSFYICWNPLLVYTVWKKVVEKAQDPELSLEPLYTRVYVLQLHLLGTLAPSKNRSDLHCLVIDWLNKKVMKNAQDLHL